MRFPGVKRIAKVLRQLNRETETGDILPGDQDTYVDVRLQVEPDGKWTIHLGDSQYDTDHRGYWGASSIPGDNRQFASEFVACDLIDQAKERAHESGETIWGEGSRT